MLGSHMRIKSMVVFAIGVVLTVGARFFGSAALPPSQENAHV